MPNRKKRKAAKRRSQRKGEANNARRHVERQGPSVSLGDVAQEYAKAMVDEAEAAFPELDTDVDLEERFG
jgi:hypothetical protein